MLTRLLWGGAFCLQLLLLYLMGVFQGPEEKKWRQQGKLQQWNTELTSCCGACDRLGNNQCGCGRLHLEIVVSLCEQACALKGQPTSPADRELMCRQGWFGSWSWNYMQTWAFERVLVCCFVWVCVFFFVCLQGVCCGCGLVGSCCVAAWKEHCDCIRFPRMTLEKTNLFLLLYSALWACVSHFFLILRSKIHICAASNTWVCDCCLGVCVNFTKIITRTNWFLLFLWLHLNFLVLLWILWAVRFVCAVAQ